MLAFQSFNGRWGQLALLCWGLALETCATDAGDAVHCPTCNNVTELLVGNKCVPIAEVDACGPDGHLHGTECHCFGGQSPTTVGGTDYCLQASCSDDTHTEVDIDAEACAHHEDTPESVTPVTVFADFGNAHVDLEMLAELTLPAASTSYIHFPGDETGHVLAFLNRSNVFAGAYNAAQQPLVSENVGANEDCASDFVEVWDVAVVNDTDTVAPQILAFETETATTVRLVLLEEHVHE